MDTICYGKEDTLVAAFRGEIDHHVAARLRAEIDEALTRTQARHLVFDFSGVTFMDSAGVGMVLGRYKRMRAQDGTVTVRGADKLVRQILEMSGVFSLPGCVEEKEEDRHNG